MSVTDDAEPPRPPSGKLELLAQVFQEGVYIMAGAASSLMLCPPFTIRKDEIDHAMGVVDGALAITDAEYQE